MMRQAAGGCFRRRLGRAPLPARRGAGLARRGWPAPRDSRTAAGGAASGADAAMSTHRPLRTAIVATVALLTLLVAGCSSEARGADEPVATNEVTMLKSHQFSPEAVLVVAGTTVTWRNQDNFTHSVKLLDGSEPDHLVKPGESVQILFVHPGTFKYESSLHPHDMRGTVIVTSAPSGGSYGGQP